MWSLSKMKNSTSLEVFSSRVFSFRQKGLLLWKNRLEKVFIYFSGYYGYGFGHYGTYQVLAAESVPRTTTSFGMTTTTTPYTTTTSYIYTTTYGQRQGMSYSVTNKSLM